MQAVIIVRSDGLLGPDMVATICTVDGRFQMQGAPVADTKQQLGGHS